METFMNEALKTAPEMAIMAFFAITLVVLFSKVLNRVVDTFMKHIEQFDLKQVQRERDSQKVIRENTQVLAEVKSLLKEQRRNYND